MIIGLTGGSGTGKSTVSLWFKKKGYKIIDGDVLSRELTEKGSPILKRITETFGEEYLLSDGSLDRRKLGGLVFTNEEARLKLNAILHPAIFDEVKDRIKDTENAVIEGAAIHECDIWKICDKCIFVSCPEEVRIDRIMKRDNISYEYAKNRVNAQKSDEYYREICDIEIANDGQKPLEQKLEDLKLD